MNQKEQIIEYILQDIIEMIITNLGMKYDEAMNLVYNSQIFDKLQDTDTGLYLESSAYIYDLLKDEINFGRIVQAEI